MNKNLRDASTHDVLFGLITSRERTITRLLAMLIASQVALGAYASSHGDSLMVGVAATAAALCVLRLAAHLLF